MCLKDLILMYYVNKKRKIIRFFFYFTLTQVDISNEEFHCKYLEYFRRLYVDESEFYDPDNDDVTMTASYDNNDDDHDVSAILVRGQVKHFGSDNRNDESLQLPTGNTS